MTYTKCAYCKSTRLQHWKHTIQNDKEGQRAIILSGSKVSLPATFVLYKCRDCGKRHSEQVWQ